MNQVFSEGRQNSLPKTKDTLELGPLHCFEATAEMPDIQSNLYYTDFLCCDTDTHKPTDFIQTFSIIQILHRYLIFYIMVLPIYTKKRTQKPKVTVAVAGKSELGTEHFAEHINLAFLRVKS